MITATWLTSIWNSADSLSGVVTKANWGIAGTLLLGCVFTAISIIAGNRKDDLLKEHESEREERIAQAQATAETARVEQKRLELDVAQARIQQETLKSQNLQLQSEVEKERIERLGLQARAASRRLTKDQKDKLKALLSGVPPANVKVVVFIGTDDGIPFKLDLIEAINSAGWKAEHTGQTTMGGALRGLAIVVKDVAKAPLAADALQRALKQIGLDAPGVNDPSLVDDAITLLVLPRVI